MSQTIAPRVVRTPLATPDTYCFTLPEGFSAKIFTVTAEQNMPERLMLYSLIVGLQPERVLEIGTSTGGSTALIVHAMDNINKGRVFSVDPASKVRDEVRASIAHRATLHAGHSPQALPEVEALAGGKFDFAFIDGDHSYQPVVNDTLGVLDHLADQAYLLYHDAFFFEVRDAIDHCVKTRGDVLQDCGVIVRSGVRWSGYNDEADTIRYGGMRLLTFSRSGFGQG
jgi:SAM-dependent methyltransferase